VIVDNFTAFAGPKEVPANASSLRVSSGTKRPINYTSANRQYLIVNFGV
jgi:hypothetical protein